MDALWERLNSAPPKPAPKDQSFPSQSQDSGAQTKSEVTPKLNGESNRLEPGRSAAPAPDEDKIAIKRTYVFAGETITEEKLVPRSSAEARLYLQSQEAAAQPPTSPVGGKPLRRPKKRASMFEPNPEGIVKGLSPMINKGPKLNTIEKSKLDWATHVDQEGLKEELDVAEKAKDGYLGRMDFLGRSEAKREEDMKNARKK